jgi:hypothetical protein
VQVTRDGIIQSLYKNWLENKDQSLWWADLSVEQAKLLDPDADFSDLREGERPALNNDEVGWLLKREGLI